MLLENQKIEVGALQDRNNSKFSYPLAQWVKRHGSVNGTVTAKVYKVLEYAGLNLPADALLISDGTESDLSRVRGSIITSVLTNGEKQPLILYIYPELASRLIEVPNFWLEYLNIGQCAVDPEHKYFSLPKRFITVGKIKHCQWCKREIFISKNFVVYSIKNKITKRRYFGSTNNRIYRWKTHLKELEALTHANPGMCSDARIDGADAFQFKVIARFDNRCDMLNYEQLLIAMHWNRDGCYNIAKSVDPAHEIKKIRIIEWFGEDPKVREFLTLHAAIRTYRLSKQKVKEAIAAGHGRVGRFQFPITVPINSYRYCPVTPPQRRKTSKKKIIIEANQAFEQILILLDKKIVSSSSLLRMFGIKAEMLQEWETRTTLPRTEEIVLINLITKYGIKWIREAPIRKFGARDLEVLKLKLDDDACIIILDSIRLSDWSKLYDVRFGKSCGKIGNYLLCLLDYYGPKYFKNS